MRRARELYSGNSHFKNMNPVQNLPVPQRVANGSSAGPWSRLEMMSNLEGESFCIFNTGRGSLEALVFNITSPNYYKLW